MSDPKRNRRVVAFKVFPNDEIKWEGRWWLVHSVERGEHVVRIGMRRGSKTYELDRYGESVVEIRR